jgi:hypothetical protein
MHRLYVSLSLFKLIPEVQVSGRPHQELDREPVLVGPARARAAERVPVTDQAPAVEATDLDLVQEPAPDLVSDPEKESVLVAVMDSASDSDLDPVPAWEPAPDL